MAAFLTNKNPLNLPNVVIHSAGKTWEKINNIADTLVEDAGYLPKNIHLVFIDAPKGAAEERNASRQRSIPLENLETYQKAAAKTFKELIERPPKNIQGKFIRVLNDRTFADPMEARKKARFIVER
jgi:hypothetical protein